MAKLYGIEVPEPIAFRKQVKDNSEFCDKNVKRIAEIDVEVKGLLKELRGTTIPADASDAVIAKVKDQRKALSDKKTALLKERELSFQKAKAQESVADSYSELYKKLTGDDLENFRKTERLQPVHKMTAEEMKEMVIRTWGKPVKVQKPAAKPAATPVVVKKVEEPVAVAKPVVEEKKEEVKPVAKPVVEEKKAEVKTDKPKAKAKKKKKHHFRRFLVRLLILLCLIACFFRFFPEAYSEVKRRVLGIRTEVGIPKHEVDLKWTWNIDENARFFRYQLDNQDPYRWLYTGERSVNTTVDADVAHTMYVLTSYDMLHWSEVESCTWKPSK